MYWFVIYAARAHSRARAEAPHVSPPRCGSWLECPPLAGLERQVPPARRYTALLGDRQWAELCEELGLDLDAVCGEEGCCGVCEVGPPPAVFVEEHVAQLPGINAVVPNMRECVVGQLAALAFRVPGAPTPRGAAATFEVSLCVAPLPQTDAERERSRSLFAAAVFNVGGYEAELRCPDCGSPGLRWLGGPDPEAQVGCENCGARLARDSALLRLGECEAILAAGGPGGC